MALEGLFIKLTHTGTVDGPLLISDVDSGFEHNNTGARERRPGSVYVGANSTVYLQYTATVAHSHESGAIRTFVDDGKLTASVVAGSTTVQTFLYDFAEQGGAVGAITLTAVDGSAKQLRVPVVAVRGWIEVTTALTSGGAATIAVGVTGTAAAFRTATAVASYSANAVLAFDGSQVHNGTDAAAPVATRKTAAQNVIATIAAAALTGGKFYVHIETLASVA
jgi:hypothetical protein